MEANQFRVTLDWLNDMGYEFTREEKQYLARKMRAIRGPSLGPTRLTVQDIADILGVSHSTVTRYLAD